MAVIACSVLWHISACIYFATSGLRHDWSATPLLWLLTMLVTPAICFAGGMILVNGRKSFRFTLIESWALVAIFLPVTAGTLLSFWVVKILLTMSGI
jgi:hypothetical protein